MTTVSTKSRITPEEFLSLSDSVAYELVDGQLVERNLGAESSAIACVIGAVLGNVVKSQRAGHVFDGNCGYRCFPANPGTVRKPDVSFVARGRLDPDGPPEGDVLIPPDLLVEVLSPCDLACEVDEKIAEYLQAGVRLIWVVNPNTRNVRIHRPSTAAAGPISSLNESDTITGEDVLPGFECKVSEFFDL